MTNAQIGQAMSAALAAAVPWIVVALARGQARRSGVLQAEPPGARLLSVGTVVAVAALVGLSAQFAPPSREVALASIVAVLALGTLAWRVLQRVSAIVSPVVEVQLTTREASLTPRRLRDYLDPMWRLVPIVTSVAGLLALLLLRRLPNTAGRQTWIPVLFGIAAVVVAWLYDRWMRDEVLGAGTTGAMPEPHLLRARVRRIFALDLAQVLTFALAGHVLLDANWRDPNGFAIAITAVAGLLGAIGCASILARDLTRRRVVLTPR